MRIYPGPTVAVTGDSTRELGRIIIRDPQTSTNLVPVPSGAYLAAAMPGNHQDYFLDFAWKRCLFRDTFAEANLKWYSSAGTCARTTGAGSYASDAHCRLTTGAAAGNPANMNHTMYATPETNLALVVLWSLFSAADNRLRYIDFALRRGDPSDDKALRFRYFHYNGGVAQYKWQYYNTTPAWADIALGGEQIINNNAYDYWNLLVATADFTTATYATFSALRTNKHQSIVVGQEMADPAFSAQETLDLDIEIACDTAGAAVVNIGYVGVFEVN